ncbi:hypothetical protein R1sor_000998 [Riccia sorocarpa]|uniref:BUD13 homolog n=1 Tax=Riccia sorocarpa TaxID=122646 RepID=A0ABD3GYX3_9MARC
MATSMQDYLKRYNVTTTTRGDDEVKLKKKKKVKASSSKRNRLGTGVVIVDNDGVWQKEELPEEEEFDEGDKPTVVEDVDVKVMQRMEKLKSYRPYLSVANDGSGWVTVKGDGEGSQEDGDGNLGNPGDRSSPRKRHDSPDMSPPRKRRDTDLSPPREKATRDEGRGFRRRHDSPDLSPPRKRDTKPSEYVNLSPARRKTEDISPPRRKKATEEGTSPKRHDSPDFSPPRRKRDADLSRLRRHDSTDISPPRRKRDTNLSPPRRHDSPDISPPKRKRDSNPSLPRRYDSRDNSPPRRGRDADLSPPRKRTAVSSLENGENIVSSRRRHDSADLSPPRRREESELSPLRKRATSRNEHFDDRSKRGRNESSRDLSPPRKKRDSPDISPPRRRRGTGTDPSSPRRKFTSRQQSDPGGPGRRRDSSEDVTREALDVKKTRIGGSVDLSPPRRHDSPEMPPSRRKESNINESGDEDRNGRRHKMADGSTGGLRTDKQVTEEIQRKKAMELKALRELDPSASGRGAETVYRDKRGRRLEGLEEFVRQQKGEEKPPEKPLEWGKGLAQKRELETKFAELEAERNKPFARTRDDPELDKELRETVRWGDPMAHLVKTKIPEPVLPDLGASEEMKASGFIIPQDIPAHSWIKRRIAPPANRYGIKPGRHWDGVDRSTGYERDMFKAKNEKKALEQEAYLWSVADMLRFLSTPQRLCIGPELRASCLTKVLEMIIHWPL